jgi:hypothetical protein
MNMKEKILNEKKKKQCHYIFDSKILLKSYIIFLKKANFGHQFVFFIRKFQRK